MIPVDVFTTEDVARYVTLGEISDEAYARLFDYFLRSGEMPYLTAKARTGDPHEWVANRLYQEFRQAS